MPKKALKNETPHDPATELLESAAAIVAGNRIQQYGKPEDSFTTIAELWSAYLGPRLRAMGLFVPAPGLIRPEDVPILMILFKTARLEQTPAHADSAVDVAGYAACLARVVAAK